MFFGAIGGSDTFVFGSDNGTATIVDYNRIQGVGGTESDRIDLTAAVNGEGAALTWDDLDTNGNNVLDDGDDFITTGALSDLRIADDTAIDLGAAAGGPAGVNVLTIERLTDLVETDFVFA